MKRKNILEAKLFIKKYERVAKHISGMPKLNLTPHYQPSVFCENLLDPKMDIPQNTELFEHVIKYANNEAEKDAGKQK